MLSSILYNLWKGYENNIMAKLTLWNCCLMALFTLKFKMSFNSIYHLDLINTRNEFYTNLPQKVL